ncbi:MAG: hypothetical protein IJ928_08105 [Prevotella sp.]|nr:hypothetical protein [Prevotella sp.]
MANLTPQFAVKPEAIFNPLIINTLQSPCKNVDFVKIFHNFYTLGYPPFSGIFRSANGGLCQHRPSPEDAAPTDGEHQRKG